MEDQKIVELYWQRDERAVAETKISYEPYCRAIAWRILKDESDTEECVADTWLKAWFAIPPQKPNVLSAFLGRITRNLSFSRYREKTARKRLGDETALALGELGECVSGREDPAGEVELQELQSAINRFLHALPERDCDIFLLRYYHVYPIASIAVRFSLKETTVKGSLLRTRRKLRSFLEKEGYVS